MHLIFLSSSYPRFEHKKAGSLVFASLLREVNKLGHKVSFITAHCFNEKDEQSILRLKKEGINYLGDLSEHIRPFPKNKIVARLRILLKPLFGSTGLEVVRPKELCSKLKSFQPSVLVFFWDTLFERALPFLEEFICVGYLAKAWWSSALSKIESGWSKSKIKTRLLKRFYNNERNRYFQRLKYFKKLANISLEDVEQCQKFGVDCLYIPNTWVDNFGSNWLEKRSQSEGNKINILANIGNLSATGNTFGLLFLAEKVLPLLDEKIDWQINICGAGKFRSDVSSRLKILLEHPKVKVKGFVPDIDQEMLSNQILLLLNNAGPYTGGYTRVIYGFSSGICMIAHKNLAFCMPEVKYKHNCLLGSNAKEIALLLEQACRNSELRLELGKRARQTYEEKYRPKIVAQKIVEICI